jgi:hypothetical protein
VVGRLALLGADVLVVISCEQPRERLSAAMFANLWIVLTSNPVYLRTTLQQNKTGAYMEMIPTPDNTNQLTRLVVGLFIAIMQFMTSLSFNA